MQPPRLLRVHLRTCGQSHRERTHGRQRKRAHRQIIMGIFCFKMDIVFGLLMQCNNIGCSVEISPGCKNSRFSDSDRAQEHSAEHYFFLFLMFFVFIFNLILSGLHSVYLLFLWKKWCCLLSGADRPGAGIDRHGCRGFHFLHKRDNRLKNQPFEAKIPLFPAMDQSGTYPMETLTEQLPSAQFRAVSKAIAAGMPDCPEDHCVSLKRIQNV